MSVEQAVIVLFVVQLDLVVVGLDSVEPLSGSIGPFVMTIRCGGAVILGPGGIGKLIPKSDPGSFIPSGGHNEINPQKIVGQPMFQRPSGHRTGAKGGRRVSGAWIVRWCGIVIGDTVTAGVVKIEGVTIVEKGIGEIVVDNVTGEGIISGYGVGGRIITHGNGQPTVTVGLFQIVLVMMTVTYSSKSESSSSSSSVRSVSFGMMKSTPSLAPAGIASSLSRICPLAIPSPPCEVKSTPPGITKPRGSIISGENQWKPLVANSIMFLTNRSSFIGREQDWVAECSTSATAGFGEQAHKITALARKRTYWVIGVSRCWKSSNFCCAGP